MSIIIKNVDLPENFEAIAIITRTENKGKACYNTVASYYGSRDVIQIPKGHGRIGDLDELQVNVIKAMTYGDALHEIKKAPIILESEVMPDEG